MPAPTLRGSTAARCGLTPTDSLAWLTRRIDGRDGDEGLAVMSAYNERPSPPVARSYASARIGRDAIARRTESMHALTGSWIANIDRSHRDPNHLFHRATIRF